MKRHFRHIAATMAFVAAMAWSGALRAQQWTVTQEELPERLSLESLTPVDGGSSVLGVGWSSLPEGSNKTDGVVVRVSRDGDCEYRTTHVPGMWLAYKCATQLDNGDYMVFGICEDSLSDISEYGHYLRVDVLDTLLEPVSSRLYRVDDTLFGCFNCPLTHDSPMKSLPSLTGTVLLATSQYRYPKPTAAYKADCLCFYEFDAVGDTLRAKAPMEGNLACLGSGIKCVTRSPGSGAMQVFLEWGNFNGNNVTGFKTVDDDFEIVGSKALHKLPGSQWLTELIWQVRTDGRWDDDGHMIVCAEMTYADSQIPGIYHQTLYRIDTLGNNLGELHLPPADSSLSSPDTWNTAYVDDSTIFVLNSCGTHVWDMWKRLDVTLVDKRLNILGRKVVKPEEAGYSCGQPAVFDDGGCVFPLYNTDYNYKGERVITQTSLVKITRDDIEITWDVVPDDGTGDHGGAYPNPVSGVLNIPVKGVEPGVSRLRITSADGKPCVDTPINSFCGRIVVDVGNLDPGVYVYQVTTNGKADAGGKFVKK